VLVLTAESFDRITRVAARALRTSLVMISIRDADQPHFETVAGVPDWRVDEQQLRQARALCRHVFDTGALPAVEQRENSLHGTGTWLGIPLRKSDGTPMGALCAIDGPSRIWSDEDRALLTDLVALFENELDLSAEIRRRRSAEETSDLVTRELAHRIKNIFAVIASIVSLSVRGHPEARNFANEVGERIAALGRANDYVRPHIISAPPGAQSLLGLIMALMAPYQERDRARIDVQGEDAPVGQLSVTTLALVLHELATNAVKYGALSSPVGSVSIQCDKVADSLTLTWREQDGPAVSGPPTQQGFGTILSGRAAATQLGAVIDHDWRPEGLVLRMTIPLQRLAK
jgi:two-component sensor histidine kinase